MATQDMDLHARCTRFGHGNALQELSKGLNSVGTARPSPGAAAGRRGRQSSSRGERRTFELLESHYNGRDEEGEGRGALRLEYYTCRVTGERQKRVRAPDRSRSPSGSRSPAFPSMQQQRSSHRLRVQSYNESQNESTTTLPSPRGLVGHPDPDANAAFEGRLGRLLLEDDEPQPWASRQVSTRRAAARGEDRHTITGDSSEDFEAELDRSRRGSGHAVYGGRLGTGTTVRSGTTPSGGTTPSNRRASTDLKELKPKRAFQTREEHDRQASARALERIQAKEAAKARADFMRNPLVQTCQTQLLMAAVAVRFAVALRAASKAKRVAAPGDQKRNLAALVIQRMRKRKNNLTLWHTAISFVARLEHAKPRFCLAVRCWRRGRSADRMRTFLTEYLTKVSRFKVLMYKFTRRVRQCQRAIRDFLACRDGRLIALRRVWNEQRAKYLEKKYGAGAKSVEFGRTVAGGSSPGKRRAARRRSMASSNSPENGSALLGDQGGSLSSAAAVLRLKHDTAVLEEKREECLRRLLKRQRTAYLDRERQAAKDQESLSVHAAMQLQDAGKGRRRQSVSKLFSPQDIQEIMFADRSVKKVDQLFDTLEKGQFLLFRSFHDDKCATVKTVVRSLVAEAEKVSGKLSAGL